ncbi:MAG TPA: FUSC family protein [Candidatus Dormibacteraeota bacterium]|nr:FUSC family protein [Candidatus Dormibacteraeota bacterium]
MPRLAGAARRLTGWLTDPGPAGPRRAARAALVTTGLFALTHRLLHEAQVVTFVAFGAFAFLAFIDFGGPVRDRILAYTATALAGSALIALGTAVSPQPWGAALVMLAVGFWVQFVGVLGGYVAGAQPALLLAYVLAATIPSPPGAIPARLAGWLVATAGATAAAVLLWPRHERQALYERAAAACRALAELVLATRREGDEAEATPRATEAVREARRAYAATPHRPAGPTRRDRALAQLVTELDRVLAFASGARGRGPAHHPCLAEGSRLVVAVVDSLRAGAAVLTGGPPPDLSQLQRARVAHRLALDRWAGARLRAGAGAEEVLDGLEADHRLRVISYLSLAIGANATIAAGRSLPAGDLPLTAGTPRLRGASGIAHRVGHTIRTHLSPASTVLQTSLRTAVGLAVSVLAARLLNLDHAFWVVLGTLSALRSSALGTGWAALQVIGGTVLGVAIGAAFAVVAGSRPALLWAALPVAIFFATSAPRLNPLAGQAAFSVELVVLFNLIAPVGWRVGLVRVEDVAVGAGISLVAGTLLWPRGARRQLCRALAVAYRQLGRLLEAAAGLVLDPGDGDDGTAEVRAARQAATEARRRAGEAFERFLEERGSKHLPVTSWAFLVNAIDHVLLVGDLAELMAATGYRARSCLDQAERLRGQAHRPGTSFRLLADRLEGSATTTSGRLATSELRSAAAACLRAWDGTEGSVAGRSAIALALAAEWLEQLDLLAADLEPTVAAAAEVARRPWWH